MLDQHIGTSEVATLPLEPRDGHKFGGKVAGLNLAATLDFQIPATVALSPDFIDNLAHDWFWEQTGRAALERHIHFLETSPHFDGNLIVRSSHDQESESGGSTSGLFQSHSSCASLEEIREKIIEIVEHSKKLCGELEGLKLSPPTGRLSALIQPLISGEISGIASILEDRIEIEYTDSVFSELMSGSAPAKHTFILWGSLPPKHKGNSNSIEEELLQVLPYSTLRKLVGKSMEFLIKDGKFISVQINNFNSQTVGYRSTGALNARPEHCQSISKLKAMQQFVNCGLFTNPVLFVAPEIGNEDAIERIRNFWTFGSFITLRLARGSEIGLPRGFFSSLDDVRDFVMNNRDGSFELIAHPFMNVTHSFEVNIERDGFYMEHVPGIWESGSDLLPDTFSANSSGACQINCVATIRKGRVAHPEGIRIREFDPIDPVMARRFCEMASEITAQIRAMSSLSLPVNVHAVWDETSGEYQCLNIRPSAALHQGALMPKSVHTVASLSDLDEWNGEDAVLFQVTTERGREAELVKLASILAENSARVFVKFGLLSHPAMVLRDLGCAVYPYSHCNRSDSQYRPIRIQLDAGSDAYKRILHECALIDDPHFHIVDDAQPLSGFHLLSVAKQRTPSVADAGLSQHAEDIFSKYANDGAFFFERGRASFCTSGFAEAHAHFHVVKGIDNFRTFEQLACKTRPGRFESLIDAYDSVEEVGEYCVFGSIETGFAAFSNRVIGKRFFRTSIRNSPSGQT